MIAQTDKYDKMAETLQGYNTVGTLMERLKISRPRAIYLIHILRKLDYVRTSYGAEKKRLYYISVHNRQKGISYTQKINSASPSPAYSLTQPENAYYVYGRELSYEEALIYAIKQKTVRHIIASIFLFRKITNWSELYHLAKKENLVREVCALYEVSRKIVPKIRKMPKRFKTLATPKKTDKFRYIIEGFESLHFKDIEKKWKVYIPLNLADLGEYINDRYT